jgi:hypothetical protein
MCPTILGITIGVFVCILAVGLAVWFTRKLEDECDDDIMIF